MLLSAFGDGSKPQTRLWLAQPLPQRVFFALRRGQKGNRPSDDFNAHAVIAPVSAGRLTFLGGPTWNRKCSAVQPHARLANAIGPRSTHAVLAGVASSQPIRSRHAALCISAAYPTHARHINALAVYWRARGNPAPISGAAPAKCLGSLAHRHSCARTVSTSRR